MQFGLAMKHRSFSMGERKGDRGPDVVVMKFIKNIYPRSLHFGEGEEGRGL
jgi:hypothetical protein